MPFVEFLLFFEEGNKDLILLLHLLESQRGFKVLDKISVPNLLKKKIEAILEVGFLFLGAVEFIKGTFFNDTFFSPSAEDVCFIVPRISQIRDLKCELVF